MKRKFDLEAKIYMKALGLVEEPLKKYSEEPCDYNIAYVFDNNEEFRQYFIDNDCSHAYDDNLLRICKMKTTKKGTIIALKRFCDHTITRVNNYKVEPIENEEEKTKIKK